MSDWELQATIDAISRTIAANHFEMYYSDLVPKFTPYISEAFLSHAVDCMIGNGQIVTAGDGLLKVVLL